MPRSKCWLLWAPPPLLHLSQRSQWSSPADSLANIMRQDWSEGAQEVTHSARGNGYQANTLFSHWKNHGFLGDLSGWFCTSLGEKQCGQHVTLLLSFWCSPFCSLWCRLCFSLFARGSRISQWYLVHEYLLVFLVKESNVENNLRLHHCDITSSNISFKAHLIAMDSVSLSGNVCFHIWSNGYAVYWICFSLSTLNMSFHYITASMRFF